MVETGGDNKINILKNMTKEEIIAELKSLIEKAEAFFEEPKTEEAITETAEAIAEPTPETVTDAIVSDVEAVQETPAETPQV